MKITKEHMAVIQDKINSALAANPSAIADYKAAGLSDKRLRWDLYRTQCGIEFTCQELYSYLNDIHIDTALRAAMKVAQNV